MRPAGGGGDGGGDGGQPISVVDELMRHHQMMEASEQERDFDEDKEEEDHPLLSEQRMEEMDEEYGGASRPSFDGFPNGPSATKAAAPFLSSCVCNQRRSFPPPLAVHTHGENTPPFFAVQARWTTSRSTCARCSSRTALAPCSAATSRSSPAGAEKRPETLVTAHPAPSAPVVRRSEADPRVCPQGAAAPREDQPPAQPLRRGRLRRDRERGPRSPAQAGTAVLVSGGLSRRQPKRWRIRIQVGSASKLDPRDVTAATDQSLPTTALFWSRCDGPEGVTAYEFERAQISGVLLRLDLQAISRYAAGSGGFLGPGDF